jgi:hypothetical protein
VTVTTVVAEHSAVTSAATTVVAEQWEVISAVGPLRVASVVLPAIVSVGDPQEGAFAAGLQVGPLVAGLRVEASVAVPREVAPAAVLQAGTPMAEAALMVAGIGKSLPT